MTRKESGRGPQDPLPASARDNDNEADNETPIIDLAEVRQKRREREEAEAESAEVEALREQHAMQLATLQEVLTEERLQPTDLIDMIKLGIITDDEDLLPCHSASRRESFPDWEERYYAAGSTAEDPDADLLDEVHERLRAADPELSRRLDQERVGAIPEPNLVSCPLLSLHGRDTPPPCIEAIRLRADADYDPQTGRFTFEPIPPDEEDPVVLADLRPCVVMGRELYKAVMLPLWGRDDEGGGGGTNDGRIDPTDDPNDED